MAHRFSSHQRITPAIISEAMAYASREKPHKHYRKTQRETLVSESQLTVGIDPGVKTGVAVATGGKLQSVESMTITAAMMFLLSIKADAPTVFIEDARMRTWFGGADARMARSGAGVREGVGSVKRDCSIWEQFCIEQGIAYRMVHPAANKTKTDADQFRRVTGFVGRTNEHGRDAGMLVHQRVVKKGVVA